MEGPLLVLAGAGSGKTRIVTHRIAHLIQQGVNPHHILALTFTNKAAEEMKERVKKLTDQHVLVCTFHALGVRILRESLSYSFTIYDEEDSLKLISNCLDILGLKSKEFSARVFKNLISSAKNALQGPEEVQAGQTPIEKAFPAVYELYQRKLKEYNAFDFDDLLFFTVKLLQKDPELLASYQQRWHYLLIDEYQDTNHSQYMLAILLSEGSRNLFVVGDPDQSIYSWRGANIHNILKFRDDYPGSVLVRLEQNYRSKENILKAANALIKNNQSRLEKNLWSNLGEGEKLFLHISDNERDEADFVVNEIVDKKRGGNIPFSEMVVFYRTNAQSRVFEDLLLRKRIPYVIYGGISFYQRKEIKDVLAFLRLLHAPSDFVSFQRTVNIPKRGLGEATLDKLRLGAEEAGLPILEFLMCGNPKLSAKQKEGILEYCQIFKEMQSFQGSLDELVSLLVRKTRYLDYLKEDKETFEDRRENVNELIAKAAEWELLSENPTLASFLEELSLKSAMDESTPDQEKVHLMTIHNGKGLEFTLAFLAGMEEDLFPHANARGNFESLEEERRLCYVGMTRAKEYLYLTAAESRYLWGTTRMMRPSRFLHEIPRQYMQRIF